MTIYFVLFCQSLLLLFDFSFTMVYRSFFWLTVAAVALFDSAWIPGSATDEVEERRARYTKLREQLDGQSTTEIHDAKENEQDEKKQEQVEEKEEADRPIPPSPERKRKPKKPRISPATPSNCENSKSRIDLAVIVDQSGSMLQYNRKVKNFLQELLSNFSVSQSRTRVSVVAFNEEAHELFPLNRYDSINGVANAIEGLLPDSGSAKEKARLHGALNYVRNSVFSTEHGARKDAKKIIFVLSDGVAAKQDGKLSSEVAKMMKEYPKVSFFPVTFGDHELRERIVQILKQKGLSAGGGDFASLDSAIMGSGRVAAGVCEVMGKQSANYSSTSTASSGPIITVNYVSTSGPKSKSSSSGSESKSSSSASESKSFSLVQNTDEKTTSHTTVGPHEGIPPTSVEATRRVNPILQFILGIKTKKGAVVQEPGSSDAKVAAKAEDFADADASEDHDSGLSKPEIIAITSGAVGGVVLLGIVGYGGYKATQSMRGPSDLEAVSQTDEDGNPESDEQELGEMSDPPMTSVELNQDIPIAPV
eukprot:GHVN01052593.1.p1 GENE.GHVN01052593.1~~GHVN01052593.1.p1  ORF type:complete len:534 (+),score=66.43 GHVN01052593.1:1565-3166(+)